MSLTDQSFNIRKTIFVAIAVFTLGSHDHVLAESSHCQNLFAVQDKPMRVKSASFSTFGTPPQVDAFLDSAYGIHATDKFPSQGMITAGNTVRDAQTIENLVHFAIGNLVPAHKAAQWENKNIVILTPLRHIMPRAINFFAQDTAVLGDYPIPANATVLVRKGTPYEKTKYPFHIIEFEGDLRAIVETELSWRKSVQIDMEFNSGFSADPAYFNGYNINSQDFFRLIKSKYPQIQENNAMENVFHKTDYYAETAYNFIIGKFSNHPPLISHLELNILSRTLERRIQLIEHHIENKLFFPDQREQTYHRIAHLRKFNSLIDSVDRMNKFNGFYLETEIAFLNSDLRLPDFLELIGKSTELLSAAPPLILKFITNRLQRTDISDKETDSLVLHFNETISKLSEETQFEIVKDLLRYPIRDYIDLTIHDPQISRRFERIIQLPAVLPFAQKILERTDDCSFELIINNYKNFKSLNLFLSNFNSGIFYNGKTALKPLDRFDLFRNIATQLEVLTGRVGLIKALNYYLPSKTNEWIQKSRYLGSQAMAANPEQQSIIENALKEFELVLKIVSEEQFLLGSHEIKIKSASGRMIQIRQKQDKLEIYEKNMWKELDVMMILGSILMWE